MPDHQRIKKLAGTIVALYRNHCGLFWRIMIPVAVIAISLNIAQFFYIITQLEKNSSGMFNRDAVTTTANINTTSGIHPTVTGVDRDTAAPSMDWGSFPLLYFRTSDGKGITWRWVLTFLSFDYSFLMILILSLCPLTLAVACISRSSQASDIAADPTSPTAREMWRFTGHKAFKVFVAFLLFYLIVDMVTNLYGLVSWLIPSFAQALPVELIIVLIMGYQTYFLVTLSLYNPCLILEDNSIIGIFRRSHSLVSGARLRFFGIYLLTSWIASIITSVLLGVALLVLSVFIPDLAQVREALPPIKFLSLFIGGDIEIVMPQLLSAPVTVAILIAKGLIATFLVPIWAILTTLLYLERTSVKPKPPFIAGEVS